MWKIFFQSTLSGIAQVILQPCATTGLLCVVAISINSWLMTVGALLGVITATITAYLLKYERKQIALGLYGFNATLIGIANIYLFQISITSILVLLLSSVISVVLTRFISHSLHLTPFTAPFVLITWIVIILKPFFALAPAQNILNYSLPANIADILNGVGQVFLQDNFITGGLILFSLLLCSKSSFVWAAIAICFSWVLAWLFNYPFSNTQIGLYGFNAVLTAIALQNFRSVLIPIIGIALTVVLTQAFILIDWPSFTAPFVIITWLLSAYFKNFNTESRPE